METLLDSVKPDLLLEKTEFTEKEGELDNSMALNLILRNYFLDEEDLNTYISVLEKHKNNGFRSEDTERVITALKNFRPYLKKYQNQTATRIERFDHHLKISAKKLSNPALSFEEVKKAVRVRLRSALAMEMADKPRGISGKTLRNVCGADRLDSVMDNETVAQLRPISIQYENLPDEQKAKMSWKELRNRLLANEDYYLDLVAGLENNGILIGFDDSDNPLFADTKPVPELFELTYHEARRRVMYRLKDNETVYCGGAPVATGYELFPAGDKGKISSEIKMFRQATGKHLVNPDVFCEWQEVWLESGEKPENAKTAYRTFHTDAVSIETKRASEEHPYRGVVRLVRVKTARPSLFPPPVSTNHLPSNGNKDEKPTDSFWSKIIRIMNA